VTVPAAGAPLYALRDVMVRRVSGPAVFELHVPELTIARGGIVFLIGPSGSGKSTLLDLLAGTLAPSRATAFTLDDGGPAPADLAALWRGRRLDALTELRARRIGYVLQTGGLLPYLSVAENIALTARISGQVDRGHLAGLVERLDLGRLTGLLPGRLSVGERQRVAIARALAHRPAVVLADEPTASLDPPTADRVFALLVETADHLGITAVISSHDWSRAEASGRPVFRPVLERDGGVVRASFRS
jgi:putative ABC transport system ATP-binding protein